MALSKAPLCCHMVFLVSRVNLNSERGSDDVREGGASSSETFLDLRKGRHILNSNREEAARSSIADKGFALLRFRQDEWEYGVHYEQW